MTRLTSRQRAVAHALWVAALAATLFSPLCAHADRGTARLVSGGVVTGEIEIYIPGERVVIRTDSGEVVTLNVSDLTELQIAPARPVVPVPAVPAPPAVPTPPLAPGVADVPPGTTFIVVPQYAQGSPTDTEVPPQHPPQYLLRQPSARRPSLFWPLMTLTGSAAAFASGTVLMMDASYYCDDSAYYYDDCRDSNPQRAGGLALMALSLPLFILSASFLLPRKVRARRHHRAVERATRLSLAPTVDPRAGHYGGAATLRF